jgi:hypothetical protein
MHKKSVVYQKIYQDSSKVVYCQMEIKLQHITAKTNGLV